jgi:hypothetical protein
MTAPVSNVDTLLKNLKEGSFFERRKAANDLATVTESSPRIATALLNALRVETDPQVVAAVRTALNAPVHKAMISSNLILTTTEAEAFRSRQQLDAQMKQQAARESYGNQRGQTCALRLLVFGGLAMILPLFNLTIRGLPIQYTPIVGIICLIIGGIMLFATQARD